ncbi:hypothetical protein [Singulisphaera sp. PoT]|uniref:hypothetical protein n=1 Tax=Singulisphaera sp. PoT TaxID=3411797 RepID=UPI003BF55EF2
MENTSRDSDALGGEIDKAALHADKTATEAADDAPGLIRAAGEEAVGHYQAYLRKYAPKTRKNYHALISRFFRWAEARKLTLAVLSRSDILTYVSEISGRLEPQSAHQYLRPVLGLFDLLADQGFVSADPFDGYHRGLADRPGTVSDPGEATDSGRSFPWLDVMAMLTNMEAESLRRIFGEDGAAESLIRFARWRDGRPCTRCGTLNDDRWADRPGGGSDRCRKCGWHCSLLSGSPFEVSPVPLRDGLYFLFEAFLRDRPAADIDALARERGIDAADANQLMGRIQDALANEGLVVGEGLRQAVERKDREMRQIEVVRAIQEYADLMACRDILMAARNGGTIVSDLPPGMTLDEAVDCVDAQIADHDRYLIEHKDGYLSRRLAEAGERPSEVEDGPPASP